MSESNGEHGDQTERGAISDEQLPEDLQPTDDNPLAQDIEDSEAGGDPDELDEKPRA